jgi:trans-aconitate 2-methyltransferase
MASGTPTDHASGGTEATSSATAFTPSSGAARPAQPAADGAADLAADSASSTRWAPEHYLRFTDQRLRPFVDLLAQVGAESPHSVADLGCGPGNATALLSDRWPQARVLGVDNSAEMIDAAAARIRPGRLSFERADLRGWRPAQPVDVLVSNAALQWVPGHLALLPEHVAPGGWFAFQVPGNFTAPSHALLADLQRSPRWSGRISGERVRPASHEPLDYLSALAAAGAEADVWETTYTYILDGERGVVDFVSSTALRPVFAELGGPQTAEAQAFAAEYTALVREAYPPTELGADGRIVQILPYRRLFAVARVSA